MKRILGLDLGTTSIGWAVVNEKENDNEKSSIIRLGVRVNPLSTGKDGELTKFEKGQSITTNADRRMKRSMHRNLQRYKLRRKNLIECLLKNSIITKDTHLFELGNYTTFQTYRARAKAVDEEISLEEFARVLLMLNKKRGYKNNRKIKDAEEGELVDGMEIAKRLYDENLTPGQLLLDLLQKGKKNKPVFYRSDLQTEFDKIWEVQSSFYPDILNDDFKKAIRGFNKSQTSGAFYSLHEISTAKNSGKEGYAQALTWRTAAIEKQLKMEEVAYVLCDINGAINNSSKRLAMISDRSKELYFNHQTVGQYLMQQIDRSPYASLKNIIFYRQDYLDEFETIWEKQAQYHPELTPTLKKEIRDIIIFYQRDLKSCKNLVNYCELEHQEKEIEVEGKKRVITIGCKVCPKSSPLFQNFKIWQILNNLQVSVIGHQRKRIKKDDRQLSLFADTEGEPLQRFLDQEEKDILYKELSVRDKMTKKEILQLLFEKPQNLDLNYKEVEGNSTMASLFKAYQEIISLTGNGDYDFSKMKTDDVISLCTEIFKGLGYKTEFLAFDPLLDGKAMEQQPAYRLWHLLYSYAGDKSATGNEALLKRIKDICGFEQEYATVLSNVSMELDYGSLSAKAIRKILPYMMKGYEYSKACELAGYRHSARSLTKEELASKEYKSRLDGLKRNSLRNPVVEKILNQMINVVNEIVATYGKPDEIRIELARDLKKSQEEREELDKAIRKTTAESEELRKQLEDEFGIQHVTRNDILRYRLYNELKLNGYKTLYSNTYIPREELFSKRFDIEHIIPKARLFDDSFSNKTLEVRDINIEKGDMTAYEYVAGKYGDEGLADYESKVEELFTKKVISGTKRKNLLMKEADIPSDFLQRDLRDSQYIARKAREILEEMVPFVVTTTGSVTNRLREDWQLVNLMQELNWEKYHALGLTESYTDKNGNVVRHIKDWTKRNDHRHHAMDALTIAFTKRSIVQYLSNLNARSDKGSNIYGIEQKELNRDNKDRKLVFNAPMPLNEFRAEAKRHLESILVSFKAKNKVITKNINKIKTKDGYKNKVQLTPRGALHNETVYGKILNFEVEYKKVDGKFYEETILRVSNQKHRKALLKRLALYNNDPKKAFTGKNSLDKNPIWLNADHSYCVPLKVKLFKMVDVFTIKKPVDKDLKIDKVIDKKVRIILQQRLDEFGGDATKAFSNLDENPIWLNKEKGIAIKKVKTKAKVSSDTSVSLHIKKDILGNIIRDRNGDITPIDYVNTANNHHVAIFVDTEGNWQEHIVSFYEATASALLGLPIVDKNYKSEEGWKFLFSMKQNEYFVFPNEKTGFIPTEVDLRNPANYRLISPNLYRVQKFSSSFYVFRHHLETNVEEPTELRDTTWKRITSIKNLEGIVKVRINHIGEIVAVGEY
ncbi:MAG: type II CRISPR RNA-guided endonuclease Cas9 [Prevotella sp.]|nr:type II CRISPR RNA-guided endonuclease Cas9 [Prevotella sp.]